MYFPICLFVYDRLDSLMRTLGSLKAAQLASESDLIIFSDGFKDSTKREVLLVREYIREIEGFRNVTIVERSHNYGLMKSVKRGVSQVLEDFPAVIVLEDDLEVSEDFLVYMNQMLNYYSTEKIVKSISGYSIQLDEQSSSYFLYRPHSWGWATWKDRWSDFIQREPEIQSIIQNEDFNKKTLISHMGRDIVRMTRQLRLGRISSWYTQWILYNYITNGISLYPTSSKIFNIGFNGQGTHCEGLNPFPSGNYVNTPEQVTVPKNLVVRSGTLMKVNFFYSNRYKLSFRLKQLKSKKGRSYVIRDIRKRVKNLLKL